MLQVNNTAALAAMNTYLNNFSNFGNVDFSSFVTPTVNGTPITSFFGGSTGSPTALQLSSSQVAVEFPETPANLYLVVHGSGMSLPLTTLNGPIDLTSADGAVTELDLYSGGTFNVNTLTGGTQIGALTLSATEYALTSGGASLTLDGAGLPTTAGVVESILAGTYSGPDLAISHVTVNDGSAAAQLSISSSGYSFTDGAETITLSGSGLPTSLSAAQIDALVTHQPLSWIGGNLTVSGLTISNGGHSLSAALTSSSLTLTFDDYRLTLDGAFPATFTPSELDSLLSGGNLGLPEATVTSASLSKVSTGQVIETATSGVAGGSPLSGFTAALNGSFGAGLVRDLMLAADGGVLVSDSDTAEVTPSGTYVNGQLLANGQYVVLLNNAVELVENGGAAGHTVVQGGYQLVSPGASATGTEVDSGQQVVGLGGTATGTVVNSGGTIELVGGGVTPLDGVTDLTLNPGSHIEFYGHAQGSVSVTQSGSTLIFSAGSTTIADVGLAGDLSHAPVATVGPDGYAAYAIPNVVTGGGGADIFPVTSSSDDVIVTNFSAAEGDRINMSALKLFHSFASVEAAASQVGSDTVINLGLGSLTLENVQLSSLTAADFILNTSTSDFGNTGHDALLFRDTATGDWGYMSSSADGAETWHPIGPSSSDYTAIGRGDFNGDGIIDTAFRQNSTGNWGYLTINPSGGEVWHPVGPTSLSYSEIATGDILQNGSYDIVFRNPTTGDWGFMAANGDGAETWHPIGSTSTDYNVIGSGDFNGDGVFDVAFRQVSTGDWGYLSINPGGGETWHHVGPSSLSYDAVASADFLGTGKTEIAFRNPTTGDWGFMETTGDNAYVWHPIGPTSADYSVIGNGDYNADGLQDVAFRQNSTGNWGYMTVLPTGGEVWHPVGATSLEYGTI